MRTSEKVRMVPRGRAKALDAAETHVFSHRLDGSVITFLKLNFTKIAVIGYKEW